MAQKKPQKRLVIEDVTTVFGNAYLVKKKKKKLKDRLLRAKRWAKVHAQRRAIRTAAAGEP